MTKDEALKLAIEALKTICIDDRFHDAKCETAEVYELRAKALEACKLALEKDESPEPIGILVALPIHGEQGIIGWESEVRIDFTFLFEPSMMDSNVYLVPPKREWVGLSEKQFADIWTKVNPIYVSSIVFAQAIEAKIKELNGG